MPCLGEPSPARLSHALPRRAVPSRATESRDSPGLAKAYPDPPGMSYAVCLVSRFFRSFPFGCAVA
jgi:hypothetical protein